MLASGEDRDLALDPDAGHRGIGLERVVADESCPRQRLGSGEAATAR